MDLRPRLRQSFSGFTKSEVQKMEQLVDEYKEQTLEDEFCKKSARLFNGLRQGLRREASFDKAKESPIFLETDDQTNATGNSNTPEGEEDVDLSRLEFEARSSKDGAWYNVDSFRSHRFISSGEAEALVRYVGFGSDEDEWVNV